MSEEERAMRLVVGTDGSGCAAVAVDLVAAIPWPGGTTIEVVEVMERNATVSGGPWLAVPAADIAAADAIARDHALRDVEAARARLRRAGVSVEARLEEGRPSDLLASVAAETSADLIVVGSRGHGTLNAMLLGSTSAEVVDHADVPVLVARGRSLDRVVLAWDGSEEAERAAKLLTKWRWLGDADVKVVSVAEQTARWWGATDGQLPGDMDDVYRMAAESAREQADRLATGMADELTTAGRRAHADRRDGDPANAIVAAAREWKADLIVVGTHGRTGLKRLVLGSVARNVLHHATCSVLVAKAPPSISTG